MDKTTKLTKRPKQLRGEGTFTAYYRVQTANEAVYIGIQTVRNDMSRVVWIRDVGRGGFTIRGDESAALRAGIDRAFKRTTVRSGPVLL